MNEKIVRNSNGLRGSAHDNKFLFWNSSGTRDVVLPGWQLDTSEGSSVLLADRVIVADAEGPYTIRISEYLLTLDAVGLPVSASLVITFTYAPDGRSPQGVACDGSVVFASVLRRTSYSAAYAHRSPSGAWTIYQRDFNRPVNPPSFDSQLVFVNGRLQHLITCDSTGVVALAAWEVRPEGLRFIDFDPSFLQADYEFPWCKFVVDPYYPGTYRGTGQIADSSEQGCYWRLAHHALWTVKTKPATVEPDILTWKFDQQNLYVSYITDEEHDIATSEDLEHWTPVGNVWLRSVIGNMFTVGASNPLFSYTTWPLPKGFLRVRALPHKREVTTVFPELCERVLARVLPFPRANGMLYFTQPMDANCHMDIWFLRYYDYATGVITDLGSTADIVSWGEDYILTSIGPVRISNFTD